jgi:hypothetical protein
MRAFLISFALAFAVTTTVQAQNTVSVSPKFRDGALFACEVAFDNYLQDTAYLQAADVHVAGSWAVNFFPDRGIFGMLKLGVAPLDGTARIAPTDGYIINGYVSNKADQKFAIDSDTPGFELFGFDATGDNTLQAIIAPGDQGQFTVAYTLEGGSMPTTFQVILSDDQAASYSDCLGALVQIARD